MPSYTENILQSLGLSQTKYARFIDIQDIKNQAIDSGIGGVSVYNKAYYGGDKNVRIEVIEYYMASIILSEIGGTFSVIFAIISITMKIIHTMKWENNVLESVFGTFKID